MHTRDKLVHFQLVVLMMVMPLVHMSDTTLTTRRACNTQTKDFSKPV
jgi:hypothetical protein